MKKIIYYASPLVMFPIIYLIINFLDEMDIINPNILVILTCIVFFLFSALVGSLSITNKKFDYLMTAIIPFSLLLTLFVCLFFDEGCDGMPQLSLHHALNIEYYKGWLPIVFIMTAITFIFSFKPIRLSKKLYRIEQK